MKHYPRELRRGARSLLLNSRGNLIEGGKYLRFRLITDSPSIDRVIIFTPSPSHPPTKRMDFRKSERPVAENRKSNSNRSLKTGFFFFLYENRRDSKYHRKSFYRENHNTSEGSLRIDIEQFVSKRFPVWPVHDNGWHVFCPCYPSFCETFDLRQERDNDKNRGTVNRE